MANNRRHIGLLVDLISHYGRGVAEGVAGFAHLAQWRISTPGLWMFSGTAIPWLDQVDGLIVSCFNQAMLTQVQALNIPAVNVSAVLPSVPLPSVLMDNTAIGRLAAEHLLGLGLRQLAADVPPDSAGHAFAIARTAAFCQTAAEAGVPVTLFVTPSPQPPQHPTPPPALSHIQWLARLPKPVGLMACTDQYALNVLEDCRQAELIVPDDIALLGVDDDRLVSKLASPALSSVAVDFERQGFVAAELLQQLLDGQPPPLHPLLIPPRAVQARASTEVLTLDDAPIAQAVRFIRDQAHRPLSVRDVIGQIPLSRRALELRFTHRMRRSILDEIHRAKVERAKRLLIETDLKISAVAHACGLASGTRLGIIFHQFTGQHPSRFRRQHRPGHAPR